MTLREKLMHDTNDLGNVDLKQEAIATIEHIAQYMDEDELLHHSRPLALAYLALTEDASAPVVHARWIHSRYEDCSEQFELVKCSQCNHEAYAMAFYVRGGNYCPACGAKMNGGADNEAG